MKILEDFLLYLIEDPIAHAIMVVGIIGVFVLVLIAYIDAYRQGREISFWPPKIGEKVKNNSSTKGKTTKKSKELATNRPIDLEAIAKIGDADIEIIPNGISDCKLLEIPTDSITEFILAEVSRHPILFKNTFSSLPINYRSNVIFISWNGVQITVERIIKQEKAYPTMDAWLSCATLYRKATTLRYRSQKTKIIISTSELRHIINLYKKLLQNIDEFNTLNNKKDLNGSSSISMFESLFEEAEFAFSNENLDEGIVRLEALLSSIHKFLISNTPQPQTINSNKLKDETTSTPRLIGSGNKSILFVDDDVETTILISEVLMGIGYRVAISMNGEDALKAMVEHDYDLVITDIMMPKIHGFKVIIGAKTISPNAKIMVVSALSKSTFSESFMLNDNIYYLEKPLDLGYFTNVIEKVLGD
jgi:CheY-like chemotaxis protein